MSASSNDQLLYHEVKSLIARFPYCNITLTEHANEDGSGPAPCCSNSTAFLRGLIIAASTRQGLFGVLEILSLKFNWGLRRCSHLCEVIENPNEIDCTSGLSLAIKALQIYYDYMEHCNSSCRDIVLIPCTAQVIVRHSQINTSKWKSLADSSDDNNSGSWIGNLCCYHECLAFIHRETSDVQVWDFGEWLQLPADRNAENAILAVRLCPLSLQSTLKPEEIVTWNGLRITLNQWSIIIPESSQSVSERSSSSNLSSISRVLSSIYSTPTNATSSSGGQVKRHANGKVKEGLSLNVFVSGCYMGVNPCAGVGVGKCIATLKQPLQKSEGLYSIPPHQLKVFGLDSMDIETSSGIIDPCFDHGYSLLSLTHVRQFLPMLFDDATNPADQTQRNVEIAQCVEEILNVMGESNRDASLSLFLPCHDNHVNILAYYLKFCHEYDSDSDLHKRILCPHYDVLYNLEKPSIRGAFVPSSEVFLIPEYRMTEGITLLETQLFCEYVGYPLLVKGSRYGAALCSSWPGVVSALNSFMGADTKPFIQRKILGIDKCLTFAAVDGELTGAVLLTKTSTTIEGKVWNGSVSSVPDDLMSYLQRFLDQTRWTGGGEIEYVETITGERYLIDVNPRFPAWIFATSFSECNLPGNFLIHVLLRRFYASSGRVDLFLKQLRKSFSSLSLEFTRTVMEIPRTNLCLPRTTDVTILKNAKSLFGLRDSDSAESKSIDILPTNFLQAHSNLEDVSIGLKLYSEDLARLCRDSSIILENLGDKHNFPLYFLSKENAQLSLLDHSAIFKKIATSVQNIVKRDIKIQLCLSVKTQPHQDMLVLARQCGYLAECISMAEVKASLNAGYEQKSIVLTGPAKSWKEHEVNGQIKLRAIFADSLNDLENIITQITHKSPPSTSATLALSAQVIGIRFGPLWGLPSRFGVNVPSDPLSSLTRLCELIKTIPSSYGIGMHFHFASSNLGSTAWFAMAKSFTSLCQHVSESTSRSIEIIDFGGGWSPFFLRNRQVDAYMESLLTDFCLSCVNSGIPLPIIQFEPGKSITESAGGLISKVIGIREFCKENKALIVDACIGDLSTGNIRAVFWKKRSSMVDEDGAEDDQHHIHGSKSGLSFSGWQLLATGTDMIWGRSCMEFDGLNGGRCISIPEEMKIGDYVLFASSGAYDMSMQYDFADGIARPCIVI